VPAAAILFRSGGAQVAIVQPDQTVHLQKITVGRDYADRVEILQGVPEGMTIIAAPGDIAREGATIVPVPATLKVTARDRRPLCPPTGLSGESMPSSIGGQYG
jgi:multidrug efflux pump subunit AcrA (membrane-fusion protein)